MKIPAKPNMIVSSSSISFSASLLLCFFIAYVETKLRYCGCLLPTFPFIQIE